MARSIYVFCPSDAATGGPEALHQLADALRSEGAQVYMVYRPVSNVAPPGYASYEVAPSAPPSDSSDITVVLPEIWPDVLDAYPRARRILWWLSWDNGASCYERVNRPGVVQACQSHYAFDMIRRQRRPAGNVVMLSDYTRTHRAMLDQAQDRRDVVAYNPAKGIKLTRRLIRARPRFRFVPVAGLDPEGVTAILRASKVYVDFGPHPGKDRLPREAASAGCCVIAGAFGSARYWEDMPIPDFYKFDAHGAWVRRAHARIGECLSDFDSRIKDFATYRAEVAAEREAFLAEVKSLFAEECRR